MRRKVNWWWVVATREHRTVNMEEADAMDMILFMDEHIAATVCTSRQDARLTVKKLRDNNWVQKDIRLRIISNEAWIFAQESYISGKFYGRK